MNFYYKDTLQSFMQKSTEEIIGAITLVNQFDSTQLQNKSWKQQIYILQNILANYEGSIFF